MPLICLTLGRSGEAALRICRLQRISGALKTVIAFMTSYHPDFMQCQFNPMQQANSCAWVQASLSSISADAEPAIFKPWTSHVGPVRPPTNNFEGMNGPENEGRTLDA